MTDIGNFSVFKQEPAWMKPAREGSTQGISHTTPARHASAAAVRCSPYYATGGEVMEFFENTAPKTYGCEFRQGQYDMAVEIVEALKQGKHYVAEAAVGIGKSYAYLVPLILLGAHEHTPVAVATSTIALQEQLASDMERLSRMLGVECTPVMAKGQTHYLCMEKAARFMKEQGMPLDIKKDGTPVQAVSLEDVLRAADGARQAAEAGEDGQDGRSVLAAALKAGIEAGYGERKAFPFEIPDRVWSRINVCAFHPGVCKKYCPYIKNCAYHKMRSSLLTSNFIICNQDLLARHLLNLKKENKRPILNPGLKAIVVDEAHNLESKVRSAVTVRFSEKQMNAIMENAARNSTAKSLFAMSRQEGRARKAMQELFANIEVQRETQMEMGRKVGFAPGHGDRYFFRDEDGAFALLKEVADAFSDLSENLNIYYSFRNNVRRGINALEKLDFTTKQLKKLCERMEEHIVWVCQGDDGIELDFCPKDIAAITDSLFFAGPHRMILTSATLAGSSDAELENQYAYLKSSLGFYTDKAGCKAGTTGVSASGGNAVNGILNTVANGVARSRSVGIGSFADDEGERIPAMLGEPKQSPYNYDSHAMVYYAGDMPHPSKKHQKFVEMGTRRLMEILDISKGRALVLFTSKADLDDVAAELKRQKTPYRVLTQRAGASQAEVLKQFREDVNSVLLGTGAFWEGVSIEGESLSNVVIFRLPFPVPDPIIDYKCSIAQDKLMDVLVPEMVIKLKQGVGRLIRNATDRGIISIIDGRMGERSDAEYKQVVWDALPIKNRTSSLKKIRAFYETEVLGNSAQDGEGRSHAGTADPLPVSEVSLSEPSEAAPPVLLKEA